MRATDYTEGVRASNLIVTVAALAPWLGVALLGPAPTPAPKGEFAEAMAVFRAHCTPCHNDEVQRGGLRLDTAEGVKKGGNSGPLITPGKSKTSLLIQRMRGELEMPRMPQGFTPVSQAKEDAVAAWIDAGGKLGPVTPKLHWSYVPPERPPLPAVRTKGWGRNAIDRFVLAKLEENGLRPSAPAGLATLLRRISLDLTGLPPDPETDDAYLLPDPTRVERFIESRLSSPHYGERWATMWLDLARYADSNGYEKDLNRTIWPYRDWVIRAFNQDMPFDRFTIEQLAGDLSPQPSRDQLIATGFHRNTLHNEEGGVDQGEQRWLTLVDRVGTTGTTWMGTSLACAQCHDHKYDPVTHEDFYRFLAFFENVKEETLDLVPAAGREMAKQIAELEAQLKTLEGKPEALEKIKATIATLRRQSDELAKEGTTLIFRPDPAKKPETPMRGKGSYLSPGKMLSANTPGFLGSLPRSAPVDRRSLAEWLVDRKNPLTARVLVNRLWEQVFGVGLVETSDEFGTQGTRPSHPELLDWLAIELMENDWSIKHILRLIVSSETYRQSSVVSEALLKRDPDNRLLARGPRFRFSAETVRDSALVASGSLNPKIGGPSVYPYQPEGIWNLPYSGESWRTSQGPEAHRRALYTFIKRSAPYPSLMAFDAGSRESCTPRRILTNSPMQALTLLNDKAFVDMARSLAGIMDQPNLSLEANLTKGFRRVLFRRPGAAEVQALSKLWTAEVARLQSRPDDAKTLAGDIAAGRDPAKAAAYVLVAQVMMNLDEAITKE